MAGEDGDKIPPAARPAIKDYGIATGKEGLLDWAFVDERMERSRNYWVCSTRADGRPHAAPVWGVWSDGALYFGTGTGSVKGRNLEQRPQVSVHLESGDEVVIIEGVVESVGAGPGLEQASAKYAAKYDGIELKPGSQQGARIYRVKAGVVFAWLEKDFPNTATRWVFD